MLMTTPVSLMPPPSIITSQGELDTAQLTLKPTVETTGNVVLPADTADNNVVDGVVAIKVTVVLPAE